MYKAYLNTIRSNSCYPTFRAFVTIATVLSYIISAVVAIAGIVSGQVGGVLIAIVIAVVIVLVAKVGQEVSLMIADIADTTIDAACRNRDGQLDYDSRTNISVEKARCAAPIAGDVSPARNPTRANWNGVCPNCDSTIPLLSKTCPRCNASFTDGSTMPVREM